MTTHSKRKTLGNVLLGIALALPAFAGVASGKDKELLNVSYDPPASSTRSSTRPSPPTGRRRPVRP